MFYILNHDMIMKHVVDRGLRINFDQLGFLVVHLNPSARTSPLECGRDRTLELALHRGVRSRPPSSSSKFRAHCVHKL